MLLVSIIGWFQWKTEKTGLQIAIITKTENCTYLLHSENSFTYAGYIVNIQ